MKFYYPKDKNGNRIGFKTPESQVYDTNGRSLTDKLTELNSNISQYDNNINSLNNTVSEISRSINTLKNNVDTNRTVNLWSGSVSSGTQINYTSPISKFPSAKRLTFIFKNIKVNNTLFIVIPWYIWNQNTNFGTYNQYNSSMFVNVTIIPQTSLSDTGCTLSWRNYSDTEEHKYYLTNVYLEY